MLLRFLGATRQVTGSRYCLEAGASRMLVDCGLFQEREFQQRNWEDPPVDPRTLNAVCLTHAHIDHCGLLPRLVRQGYRGPILATAATVDLLDLVLRDAAQIQEEDAEFKRRRHEQEGRQARFPEQPLFTLDDVEQVLAQLQPVDYGRPQTLGPELSVTFHDAGHILGSAMLECLAGKDAAARRIIFSGDIGQWDRPILRDPSVFTQADYVVLESTYGDRNHEQAGDVETELARLINRTVQAGGNLVIPVFAIERTQELLYYLSRLTHNQQIPALDVFLDSPMAAKATAIFGRHGDCFDAETLARIARGDAPLRFAGLKVIRSTEESKDLNRRRAPAVIMATSGMCVGGRIKHHLRHNVGRPESTILFVGYQGRGTLGREILDGAQEVRIHGRIWPVRAQVAQMQGFSGHADQTGLWRWLSHYGTPPRRLLLTHGETAAAEALAHRVRLEKGWPVTVPDYQQEVPLE